MHARGDERDNPAEGVADQIEGFPTERIGDGEEVHHVLRDGVGVGDRALPVSAAIDDRLLTTGQRRSLSAPGEASG